MVQSSPPRGGEEPQTVSKWEKESHEATRELLKVKDRLIEVERNVSRDDSVKTHFDWVLVSDCILSLTSCVCLPECHTAG